MTNLVYRVCFYCGTPCFGHFCSESCEEEFKVSIEEGIKADAAETAEKKNRCAHCGNPVEMENGFCSTDCHNYYISEG